MTRTGFSLVYRRAGSRRQFVTAGVAVAALLALAGCTSGPTTSAPAPGTGSVSEAEGSATPSAAGSSVDGFGSSAPVAAATPTDGGTPVPAVTDPAVVAGSGLDEGLTPFLAATVTTVWSPDAHTYVVRSVFPTGATAESITRLYATPDLRPGEPPVLTATRAEDSFSYRLAYTIPTADLPEDLRAAVLADLPTQAPAVAAAGRAVGSAVRARPPVAEDSSVIGAVTDGVVSQGGESVVEGWAERAGGTKGSNAAKALSNGKKVWEALDLNAAIAAAQARVDAARQCAQNPTNPLTKKEWKENPAAKQQALDRLGEIADEITGNAAVVVSQMIGDAAAGAGPSWLGYITGPALNYVRDTLSSIIDDLVREAESLIPKCSPKYRVSGGGARLTVNGTINDITKPFTVNGAGDGFVVVFSYTPSDLQGRQGQVAYEGGGGGFSMSGGGDYVITGPEGGTLKLKQRTSGCVDVGECKVNTETLTLTPITN